ncbi:MAG: dihydrofolate reductase family protein [Anaerolineae bacterium]
MRKIIYHIATSIDGFIAGENGSVSDFLMAGEHADEFVQSLSDYDTVIMGTNTYKFGFQFGLKAGEPAYPGLKHIIVSKSLTFESNGSVNLVSADELATLQQLKQQAGKDIWLCGGGHLAGFMLKNNLIDELVLKINPIILGEGIKLFEGVGRSSVWQSAGSKSYSNGVVLQKYALQKS